MMTGAGVSVGGAGMLRTRRRDVSVKPNRKLDRKSSRGMIYENEELRLRTIHINAEVEQGQNDIKKLRRENEQLRREIWSLRDEYDKLEEILKRQQSHEESEEYEDRSEEDDDLQSEYSFEEDERNEEIDEDVQDSEEETNKSEQLENAENQKLSAEKMTSSSQHRLHVDFDDLSVVDEEEEPKKDKDKKELPSEDTAHSKEDKDVLSAVKPRLLHENIPFYPGTYQPQANISSPTYYSDCPFKFPSTLNLMFSPPETPGIINTPCPTMNPDPLIPLPNLTSLNMDQVNEHILHAPPVGWQSNFFLPQNQTPTYSAAEVDPSSRLQNFSSTHQDLTRQQSNSSTIGGFPSLPNFLQKRNAGLKLAINPVDSMLNFGNIARSSDRTFAENGLIMNADSLGLNDTNHLHGFPRDSMKMETKDSPPLSGSDKPKHFFAPLPSKLKRQSAAPSPTINHFATGNSSNSSKTDSTVVCKNQFANEKGSADIYVNGAVPSEDHLYKNKSEQRTFLSTGNLLIGEDKSSNPLVKSMSCQDLSSDPQSASINHNDGKQQLLTKSDNTLDSVKSASKPYKTHLTVTLKAPKMKQAASPDTPEIPKLPNIDYRLFKNPFLRTFDPTNNYVDQYNATRPLSIQVSDDNLGYYPQQAEIPILNRGVAIGDRYRSVQSDQNRLLIQSNQLLNGKLMSPVNKHQIQVTSFERPSPHTLIGPASPYDYNTIRRLNTNPYRPPTGQNLYQNMQFMPRGGIYPQRGMLYYENMATKVPAQTQTSIDGDSQHEDEHTLSHEDSAPNTPSGQRKKRMVRKEKGSLTKDHKPLSPAAQRRLRKQSSVTSSEVPPESPVKGPRKKSRRLSVTPTTTSEGQEDKNESRSSSSGQDSPKKDQTRRVSLYFNAKKRPSLTSVKTVRSGSLDTVREKEAMTINSERERTNSVSSRETGSAKARKASTSSGNVPWCACWGNGCI